MKRALKIIGLVFGVLFGVIAIGIAVAAITGKFSTKPIDVTSISWEENSVTIVEDYTTTINFLPENANQLSVTLKVDTAGEKVVEVPETVTAGKPFTIKVKKDANGYNIGGPVKISARTKMIVADSELKILVDVPIPENGLMIASDHDDEEDKANISAGSNAFGLYVFTNPSLALNPNNEKSLLDAHKDITLISGNTEVVQILNNGLGEAKEGYYCPDYIEHGHKGPFKDKDGNPLTSICNGVRLERKKYIEYQAKAITGVSAPIIIKAKALRTYSMQDDFVDKNDDKYKVDGVFQGTGRALFYEDLNNYITKYKNYIITDTREFLNEHDEVEYANGQQFLDAITYTNSENKSYLEIKDGERLKEEAAYFYFYVERRAVFNIEEVNIKNITTSVVGNSTVDFVPLSEAMQFTASELASTFGLSLIPDNDEFTPSDIEHRISELRVISIMNKNEESESPFDFDYSNIFEITNPTSNSANPIWVIKCINPIDYNLGNSKNYRLRFYLPTSEDGGYTSDALYVDVKVTAKENAIKDLRVYTGSDHQSTSLDTVMITNENNYNGFTKRQILDSSRYSLTGVDGVEPTYQLVKWFVTEDSAKTGGSDSKYFKIRLSDNGVNNTVDILYKNSTIKAYEIEATIANQLVLEALNVTNGSDLVIFAGVVKTDYNNNPLDINGLIEGEEGYEKSYQMVFKSNELSIQINNYLESLNIYSKYTDENGALKYTLRNVPTSGSYEIVKLLAANTYEYVVTPFYLNSNGGFDSGSYSDDTIDYQTNLTQAMSSAIDNLDISKGNGAFKFDTEDITVLSQYDPVKIQYDVTIEVPVKADAGLGYGSTSAETEINFYASVGDTSSLSGIFKSDLSKMTMQIFYADIEEVRLVGEGGRNTYTISPQVSSIAVGDDPTDIQPTITWYDVDDDNNVNKKAFNFDVNYSFDIAEKTNDAGVVIYNDKIDKYLGNDKYVNDYNDFIGNLNNPDIISLKWEISFADSTIGNPYDYLEVIETNDQDVKSQLIAGYLKPKKGTSVGVKLKVRCVVQLYKTNTSFIDQKSAEIYIILKQNEVKFDTYSPKTINSHDVLIENKNSDSSYELNGGLSVNLLEEFSNDKDIYVNTDGEYKYSGKTSNVLIKASIDSDGVFARFCTYTISTINIGSNENVGVYFRNINGEETRETTPDSNGDLILYTRYLPKDQNIIINITSPFGEIGYYYITIKSSISVTRNTDKYPDGQNITLSTTNGKNNFDLSQLYKVTHTSSDGIAHQLITSYSILKDGDEDGNAYATITSANNAESLNVDGETITPNTILTVGNVHNSKTIKLRLHYFAPIEGQEDMYTENYVDVVGVDRNPIAIQIVSGYEVKEVDAIKDKELTPLDIYSGVLFNFFDNDYYNSDHLQSTSDNHNLVNDFISIKDTYTGNKVSLSYESLCDFLTLEFDYDEMKKMGITEVFETLFISNTNKDRISLGILDTRSVVENVTIPVSLVYKEGINGSIKDRLFTFYVKIRATVEFSSPKDVSGETAYDGEENTVNKIIKGQEFRNYNVDTDNDGTIQLGAYTITLFDKDLGLSDNILSVHGTDNVELLSSVYKLYTLSKYSLGTYSTLEGEDENVQIVETLDSNNNLSKLVLNIKNSVNQAVYYKLSLKTTVSEFTYDYYFNLVPNYVLSINYPIEKNIEKIKSGSRIDLLSNYINQSKRVVVGQLLGNNIVDFTFSDNQNGSYNIICEDNSDLNKVVELGSRNFIKFELLGSYSFAELNGSQLYIKSAPTNTTNLVVRATLFNGAYIDYNFQVYNNLSPMTISHSADVVLNSNGYIKVYADQEYNILDFLSKSGAYDDAQYVIKYENTHGTTINGVYYGSREDKDSTTDEYYQDISNIIINYDSQNELYLNSLNVVFDDTDKTQDHIKVKFKVWTTYSIDPEQYFELKFEIWPNLIINENKSITQFVSGSDEGIIIASLNSSQNAWLTIGNKNLDGITMTIKSMSTSKEQITDRYIIDNYLTISKLSDQTGFVFTPKNVGITYDVTFIITRRHIDEGKGLDLEYMYEFTIKLVPDIQINTQYSSVTGQSYNITAAASSEENKVISVTLNDYEDLFNPTDFDGNSLDSTKYRSNAYLSNKDGSITYDRVTDGCFSLSSLICQGSSITINVRAVNKSEILFIKYIVEWGTWSNVEGNNVFNATGKESYEVIISLTIVPNLKSNMYANYVTGGVSSNEFVVYSGSIVNFEFQNNSSLILKETTKNSVTINGEQTTISNTTTSTNILFNLAEISSDSLPLVITPTLNTDNEITSITSGSIYFKAVTQGTTIEIPYYFDLSGQHLGLYNSSYANGNDDYLLDFSDDLKVYKLVKLSIRITVKPALRSFTYKSTDSEGSSVSNPINLTTQFANDVYADINAEVSSYIEGGDNLSWLKDYPLDDEDYIQPYGYKIVDLFNFNVVSGTTISNTKPTYTEKSGSINVYIAELYKTIKYEVKISLINNSIVTEEVQNPEDYYFFNEANDTIYLMPALFGTGNPDTIKAEIKMILPEQTGANTSNTVYMEFVYGKEVSIGDTYASIGYGASIVMTPEGYKMYTEDGIGAYYSSDNPNVDLNQFFKYGYLLRSVTDDSIRTMAPKIIEIPSKNLIITFNYPEGQCQYYYIFNNVDISYAINTGSTYADIVDGHYIRTINYYTDKELTNLEDNEYRWINLRVYAGSLPATYAIKLIPGRITTEINATLNNNEYQFEPSIELVGTNNPVKILSYEIVIENTGLSSEEYTLLNSWLRYDNESGKYIFTPQLQYLKRNLNVVVKAIITTGTDEESQIFETTLVVLNGNTEEKKNYIELTPVIRLEYDTNSLSQTPSLPGETPRDLKIVKNDSTGSLIMSNVFFVSSSDIENIEVTLTFDSEDDKLYSNYLKILYTNDNEVNPTEDNSYRYILTDGCHIQILSTEILSEILLNVEFTISYTYKGTKIVLTESNVIKLQRNIGIINLEKKYNVEITNDVWNSDSVVVDVANEGTAQISQIGAGTIKFKPIVKGIITDDGASLSITDEQMAEIVKVSLNGNSLHIDLTNYRNNYGKVKQIRFEVYYVSSEETVGDGTYLQDVTLAFTYTN